MLALQDLPFSGNVGCIEALDNLLQDILLFMQQQQTMASGELLELKNCSWVLHERYHMDTAAELKFTFHHTKHRMMKSCMAIVEREEARHLVRSKAQLMATG